MNLRQVASAVVAAVLEADEDDDMKELAGPPEHITGINDTLMEVLTRLGVTADRIHNRYSDTMVMCRTWPEAHQIAQAGTWRSMAEVVRTNPEHPDAKEFPWLCDIPFANLAGYIASKPK